MGLLRRMTDRDNTIIIIKHRLEDRSHGLEH